MNFGMKEAGQATAAYTLNMKNGKGIVSVSIGDGKEEYSIIFRFDQDWEGEIDAENPNWKRTKLMLASVVGPKE